MAVTCETSGLSGVSALFDLDHTLLDRHIGIGVARLDEIFDAVPVVVEGVKGFPRLGEVAGLALTCALHLFSARFSGVPFDERFTA